MSQRCPICESRNSFVERGPWLRDQLECLDCEGGSFPRERALALALERYAPNWRELRLLECSPSSRAISLKLGKQCSQYTAINYFAEVPSGSRVGEVLNEDLQALSFADSSFDLFVALDVLEHVPDPMRALKEIKRVLASNGLAIMTFPIRRNQTTAMLKRAMLGLDGQVHHITEPEFHGNPFSQEGSLVFSDFGYQFHEWASTVAGVDVTVLRQSDWTHGVLGDYTEVCLFSPNDKDRDRGETIALSD